MTSTLHGQKFLCSGLSPLLQYNILMGCQTQSQDFTSISFSDPHKNPWVDTVTIPVSQTRLREFQYLVIATQLVSGGAGIKPKQLARVQPLNHCRKKNQVFTPGFAAILGISRTVLSLEQSLATCGYSNLTKFKKNKKSSAQVVLATFKVLNSPMWLVAAGLGSTDTEQFHRC